MLNAGLARLPQEPRLYMSAGAKLGHSAPRKRSAAADHTFTPPQWPGFTPPLTTGLNGRAANA